MTDLSIVVPLYNEDESVRPLYESITNAIDPMEREVEIIFVDDGSKDHTFNVAAKIASTDKRLRVVKFRRNYGQTPAMAAGIATMAPTIIILPRSIPNVAAIVSGPGVGGTSVWVIAPPAVIARMHFR